MTSFAARFAGLATLALAALPIAALATGAEAAPVAVKVGDLNLNSDAGLTAFHQRADWAAKSFCRDATRPGTRLSAARACQAAVKAEIGEKLADARSAQLGRAAAYAAR